MPSPWRWRKRLRQKVAVFSLLSAEPKALRLLSYRFFHFRRPPRSRWALKAGEKKKDFDAFKAKEIKSVAAEKVFFCRRKV